MAAQPQFGNIEGQRGCRDNFQPAGWWRLSSLRRRCRSQADASWAALRDY